MKLDLNVEMISFFRLWWFMLLWSNFNNKNNIKELFAMVYFRNTYCCVCCIWMFNKCVFRDVKQPPLSHHKKAKKDRLGGKMKMRRGEVDRGQEDRFFTPFHTSAAAWRSLRFCDPHGTRTQKKKRQNEHKNKKTKREKRMSASSSYSMNSASTVCHLWKHSIHSTPEERPCKAQLLQSMPLLCRCEKQSKERSLVTIASFQHSQLSLYNNSV